ncbi:MAG: SH3 domain-containing protein [Bryobacteraceae bacterium]|nr:SH3 domain-containing protein [Bryobacteraceae bacterium]
MRRRESLQCLACLLLAGCRHNQREPAIGEGFVAAVSLNLYRDLGPNEPVAAVAAHGERLEILARRRKFVRARRASGESGWTDGDLLFSREQMEELRLLGRWAAGLPVQGRASVLAPLNVHTSPSRSAPNLAQIQEGQSVDVVAHKLIAENGLSEDWSLVVLPGEVAGWVLTRRLVMNIPDEVAQYAEGRRIMAYFPLGEVRDGQHSRHHWLWATLNRLGRPYEFDSLRLFAWSLRRKRYETAFLVRNLRGYYPIEVTPEPAGGYRFSLVASEKDGPLMRITYLWQTQRVRVLSRVPVEAPPPLEPPRLAPASAPAETSLLSRWRQFLAERLARRKRQ